MLGYCVSQVLTTSPLWGMNTIVQCWASSLEALFLVSWSCGSRSGSWGVGDQSMGVGFFGRRVQVGTEWMDAVWNEGLESCESDERITMSCPKEAQLGLMLRVVFCWGSSDESARSMIVVSLVFVCWGELSIGRVDARLAVVFLTWSFLTVASASVLRMLRSGGDLAIVETVLLVGVEIMKSTAEGDAAIIKGLECPGECSVNLLFAQFIHVDWALA